MTETPPVERPVYGNRIRHLRKKGELTLQQLSDRAGLSVGFLSLLERDKAAPSLGTLARLAQVLEVEIDHFITTPKPTDSLSRAGEREVFTPGGASYERLSTVLPGSTLSAILIEMPEGYELETASHPGEELIYVLEGEIIVSLAEEKIHMKVGDSLHFMGEIPHGCTPCGAGGAKLMWTGTTPALIPKI